MDQVSKSCPLCQKDVEDGKKGQPTHVIGFCNLSEEERECLKIEIMELIEKETRLNSRDLSDRLVISLGSMVAMTDWMHKTGLLRFYEE